jgi:hypothetical protein
MGTVIAVGLILALLLWLTGAGRHDRAVPPEDDTTSPLEADELAEAEADLQADPEARSIDDALEDDDDWGPGTGGRGVLPGIT